MRYFFLGGAKLIHPSSFSGLDPRGKKGAIISFGCPFLDRQQEDEEFRRRMHFILLLGQHSFARSSQWPMEIE